MEWPPATAISQPIFIEPHQLRAGSMLVVHGYQHRKQARFYALMLAARLSQGPDHALQHAINCRPQHPPRTKQRLDGGQSNTCYSLAVFCIQSIGAVLGTWSVPSICLSVYLAICTSSSIRQMRSYHTTLGTLAPSTRRIKDVQHKKRRRDASQLYPTGVYEPSIFSVVLLIR